MELLINTLGKLINRVSKFFEAREIAKKARHAAKEARKEADRLVSTNNAVGDDPVSLPQNEQEK